ncbi:MAG: hypothetical protein U9Q61_05220, partial [Thermodesulfobacteriota bacterium]|nr:hypothetical protein [Thermodesulfobacteriota bacterium]
MDFSKTVDNGMFNFTPELINETIDSVLQSDPVVSPTPSAVPIADNAPTDDRMFNFTPELIDSTIDDYFATPGITESLGNAVGRGMMGVPQLGAKAAAGTAEIVDRFVPSETAKNIAEWGDKAGEQIENIKMRDSVRREDFVGVLSQGVESAVTSMGAMIPGLAVAVGTGGTGFIPLAIGVASGSPLFGASQYHDSYKRYTQRYVDQGLSLEEAKSKAQYPAAIDGVSEVATELASDVLSAGLLSGGLKFGTKVAEKSLQELLAKNVFKQSIKKGAGITAAETIGETINANIQTLVDMKTGKDETIQEVLTNPQYWENWEKQLGPIAVASAIFGGLGAGGSVAISRQNYNVMRDGKADPKQRAAVAQAIGKEIGKTNETLKDIWLTNAAVAIGEQANIDENVPLDKMGAIKMPDVSDLDIPLQGVEGDVFHKVPRRIPQPDISRDIDTPQKGVEADIFHQQKQQATDWDNYLNDLARRKEKAYKPILDKEEADRQALADKDIARSEIDDQSKLLPIGSPGRPDTSYIGDIKALPDTAQPSTETETTDAGRYTKEGLKQGTVPITGADIDVFKNEKIARTQRSLKGQNETHDIVPVDEGYGLIPKEEAQNGTEEISTPTETVQEDRSAERNRTEAEQQDVPGEQEEA